VIGDRTRAHEDNSPDGPADVLAFLNSAPAAFLTEISTTTGRSVKEVAAVLAAAQGRAIVVSYPPPDRHITSDQRIAAAVRDGDEMDAQDRIARYWRAWIREFMSAHRCS
jgi:hypothetical protein